MVNGTTTRVPAARGGDQPQRRLGGANVNLERVRRPDGPDSVRGRRRREREPGRGGGRRPQSDPHLIRSTRRRRGLCRPPASGAAPPGRRLPAADSLYHNFDERRRRSTRSSRRPGLISRTHRHQLRGSRDVGGEDLRQRRLGRGRARGAVHRRPARARAPDDRDGALHDRPADRQLRARTRGSPASSTAGRSGSSRCSTRTAVEYDIATGSSRSWRKNRQPNAGSSDVGTDLNRNWGYRWGCCGGSTGSTAVGDLPWPVGLLLPRECSGARLCRSAATSPACSRSGPRSTCTATRELILWPYGYKPRGHWRGHDPATSATRSPPSGSRWRPATGTRLSNRATFTSPTVRASTGSGSTTGDLRLRLRDVPGRRTGGPGSTRPTSRSPRETLRNREAILTLSEYADVLYRAIGKAGPVLLQRAADDDLPPPPPGPRRSRARSP